MKRADGMAWGAAKLPSCGECSGETRSQSLSGLTDGPPVSRRSESTCAQLEREASMREAALAGNRDEVASLQEANRAAHAQNNAYVMDLQVVGGGRDGGRWTCT